MDEIDINVSSDIFDRMVKENEPAYNELKLIEELAELQEVLIKKIVKRGLDKEPPQQAITDEIGDVWIRLFVYINMTKTGTDVGKRMEQKLTKFQGYFDNNQYTGKI